MLIHIIPKFYSAKYEFSLSILDVSIPECGVHLVGDKDITIGRPYPNKRYEVVCRKKGQKAICGILPDVDGFLIDVDGFLPAYTVITRWIVNGDVRTHITEYEVLDDDFTAVSGDMTMWYTRHGTEWKPRFPDAYQNEAPLYRQPCMDLVPHALGGLQKPVEVIDYMSGDHIALRVERFLQHTIEPERLSQHASADRRIPDIADAFKAQIVQVPENSFQISNGLTVKLSISMLPKPDVSGSYKRHRKESLSDYPDVYLSFYRDGRLIADWVPWGNVISADDSAYISDDLTLDADDLIDIDDKGWDIMGRYGLFPTELICAFQKSAPADPVTTS